MRTRGRSEEESKQSYQQQSRVKVCSMHMGRMYLVAANSWNQTTLQASTLPVLLSPALTPGSSQMSRSTARTLCMAKMSSLFPSIAVLENVSKSPGMPCQMDPSSSCSSDPNPSFLLHTPCVSFGPHPLQGLNLSVFTTVPFGIQLPVFHLGDCLLCTSSKRLYEKFNRSLKKEYS